MTEAGEMDETAGARQLLCLVPPELAPKLGDALEEHFAGDAEVEVRTERRDRQRRSGIERRVREGDPPGGVERRLVHSRSGRRAGERRAELAPVEPPAELPRKARKHAERLRFVERLPLSEARLEQLETDREIVRFQSGEREAFERVYAGHFDRVFAFLKLALDDHHEAEDLAQETFVRALVALPDYELRGAPFEAWLFRVARNLAVNHLRRLERVEATDPFELNRVREANGERSESAEEDVLRRLSDQDLLTFIGRMPPDQRRVVVLRYMLDLDTREIAEAMDRSEVAVRRLQQRAFEFLRKRFKALGKEPQTGGRSRTGSRAIRRQARVVRERKFMLE